MKWIDIQGPVRQYVGRGTEQKLERYPQRVEKRKDRGGIGGDEWGCGRASRNTCREMKTKIVKSITSSESSGLMKRSQQARQSQPAGKMRVSLTIGEMELSTL
jgi:hypothetical protein